MEVWQYEEATPLLGENFIYNCKAALTILMCPFKVIEPISNMKAKTIVAYTDAETTHHSWLKSHVPVYKLVIQYGVLRVVMRISVSAR